MGLISNQPIYAVNYAERCHNTGVVAATGTSRPIEDDRVSAMEIPENGPAHVDFSDRVPVRFLLNKIGGRLPPQDRIRQEARMILRVNRDDEDPRRSAD